MNDMTPFAVPRDAQGRHGRPINLSRRALLGSLGGLALAVTLPAARSRAAAAAPAITPGSRVRAFLEIRPDNRVLFRSAFIEGGQGIFTAMAQIVGEELDVDPAQFLVEGAPAGADYLLVNGQRFTGGSFSVRSSYETMRKLGASARHMLLQAAVERLGAPLAELSTEPGRVIHNASGRSLAYGELASAAAALPVPADVALRDRANFRWIGKPVARLDVRDKSTGKARYAIDQKVEGMLHAAVQHARRLGQEPGAIANEAQARAMPGVHSIHWLPGAVAVLATSWHRARRAVEALEVSWIEPAGDAPHAMPADFSSEAHLAKLKAAPGTGLAFETVGDTGKTFRKAARIVEATFDAPHLAHGQLEPPSALARWNEDGTLELWISNQGPELFQADAAKVAGIAPEKIIIHSPMLGGFFGRHFLYQTANPYPQAILLAKAAGRPVKLIWSREDEFLRDALRPMAVARLRAGLDAKGMPIALEATAIGEGALGRWFGREPDKVDRSSVEGIAGKLYAIPNRRVGQIHIDDPAIIGFWRSVGHSTNDFFYETFFDEIAEAGKHDPFELRHRLLADHPRQKRLLEAVAELGGGWRRGPFTAADGTTRARGVAMASPFGSEVATIAEVSLRQGEIVVHDVFVAIDPGSIVNPAIVEAQVQSAVALGLSSALLEKVVYEQGQPRARNFDAYPILTADRMPRVHVRIIESGAPMGGVGEPGLPGVPPAVANAASVLIGRRIRSLPMSKQRLAEGGDNRKRSSLH
ncbi:oxidoreductase [Methylosinus sp. C49]|uniref:xanthine dehydrogenase family protein molybdopterin-binding subunit n=1 Tax=Methylosinus sp. C49 TaxID=2699395 RepID=UPI001366E551|nr:xanthine dehydrogenase family protein molybdopterin-binding subunit [Methylosinus sp. C49]BBU63290.1 oxidoreductase [Methylosinus sp. C49]